jgi:hypothetical protein
MTVGDGGGVADYSLVDRISGSRWYRVSLAGVNSGAANARLRIVRHADDASAGGVAYTDGAYLNVGIETAPTDGWISAKRTENNNGLDAETDLNHIDVWGIPGDADAIAFWKITAQILGLGFYMGRMTDGIHKASVQPHWIDSADGTGTNGTGAWSTVNDSGLSGDSSARFTEGAGAGGGYFEWTISGDEARRLAATPRRIIGLVQVDAVDATFLLGAYADSGNTNLAPHNVKVNPAVAGAYTLLDLGSINLVGVFPENVPDTSEPDLVIRITLSGMTNTEKADIDALFLPPVKDDFMIYHIIQGSGFGASGLWIDGHNHSVVPEDRGFDRNDHQGTMWTLAPGQTMNRIVFMTFNNASQFTFDLAAGFDWRLEVTPRGRHLIGSR